jgi:hypothetical protein
MSKFVDLSTTYTINPYLAFLCLASRGIGPPKSPQHSVPDRCRVERVSYQVLVFRNCKRTRKEGRSMDHQQQKLGVSAQVRARVMVNKFLSGHTIHNRAREGCLELVLFLDTFAGLIGLGFSE